MNDIFYLAPIRGVTDRIYRNAFTGYFGGFDLAVAPFLSEKRSKRTSASIIRDIAKDINKLNTIPQILEKEPARFIQLANVGCPFPGVLGKGKGAALLPFPQEVDSFLEKVMENVNAEISVKCRLGLDNDEDIFALIPVFNKHKIRELIVHPRTAKQMYDGKASADAFQRCLEISDVPLVYNGDIFAVDDFHVLKDRFPDVNRWMIGRGVLRNPFLLKEIKTGEKLPDDEKLAVMKGFHDELFREYSQMLSGPAHLTDKMKAVWAYTGECFEDSARIVKRIKKTQNEKSYLNAVNEIFSSGPLLKG